MLVKVDDLLLFLGDKGSAFARAFHGSDEQVVPDDVQLFLVISRRVRRTSQTCQVDQGCSSDVIGYRFEGELQRLAEESNKLSALIARASILGNLREVSSGFWVLGLLFCDES